MNLMYRPLYWFGKGATPDLNLSLSLANAPQYSDGGTDHQGDDEAVQVVERRDRHRPGRDVLDEHAEGREAELGRLRGRDDPGRPRVGHGERQHAHVQAEHGRRTRTGTRTTSSRRSRRCRRRGTITKAGQNPQLCGTASYQQVTTQTHTTSKGTTVMPISAAAKSCAAVYNVPRRARRRSSRATPRTRCGSVVDGPFDADALRHHRQRDLRPEPEVLGPGEAEAGQARRAAVHGSDDSGVQRSGGGQGGRRHPAAVRHHVERDDDRQRPAASSQERTTRVSRRTTTSYAGSTVADQLLPAELQLHRQRRPVREALQPALLPAGLPDARQPAGSTSSTSPRATACRRTGRCRSVRRTPSRIRPEATSAIRTRTARQKAINLLTANGWTVNAGGTSVCADAAKCGVPTGTQLSFTLQYVGGTPVRGSSSCRLRSRPGRRPAST